MESSSHHEYRRTRKVTALLCSLMIAAGLLSACGSDKANEEDKPAAAAANTAGKTETAAAETANAAEEAGSYPMTVTDELGHEVKLPAKPVKIFAPTMEDSLLALGIKPALQWSNGVEPQLYLQDQLSDVPPISFATGAPSFEELLASKPDLIILHNSYYGENGLYEQYAKIAPTYVFENASNDLSATIQTLGKLVDDPKKAEEALSNYASKASEAKSKLAGAAEGKKAAIIRFNAKGMFFMNADYYSGYVLAHDLDFGQSSLVSSGAFEVSLEVLPDLDADYIFLVNDGNQGDAFVKELKESKVWQSIPAVKSGHVYETTSDYWLSGGFIAQSKVIDDVIGFLAP